MVVRGLRVWTKAAISSGGRQAEAVREAQCRLRG